MLVYNFEESKLQTPIIYAKSRRFENIGSLLAFVRVCFNWFIDASWGGTLAMAGAACVRTHKLHPYTFGQNVANK